jgi:DNA-binding NarL/FixJ family response regulator
VREKVLLIVKVATVRVLVLKALNQRGGVEILATRIPDLGIEVLRRTKCDLAIIHSEISEPGMSWKTLVETFEKIQLDLPILLLLENSHDTDFSSVNRLVTLPTDEDCLRATIEELLNPPPVET